MRQRPRQCIYIMDAQSSGRWMCSTPWHGTGTHRHHTQAPHTGTTHRHHTHAATRPLTPPHARMRARPHVHTSMRCRRSVVHCAETSLTKLARTVITPVLQPIPMAVHECPTRATYRHGGILRKGIFQRRVYASGRNAWGLSECLRGSVHDAPCGRGRD